MKTTAYRLYVTPGLPTHWVGEVSGSYWLFPAQRGGWEQRKPYLGHRQALQPVTVTQTAMTTGFYEESVRCG